MENTVTEARGLAHDRHFTTGGVPVFDKTQWKRLDAIITDAKGNTVFEQKNIEAPASWSQTAVNIVASKYFHGAGDERESSVRELISRVVRTIVEAGRKRGYFMIEEDAEAFRDDLTFLLVNQYAAFNSPVWFNVGVDRLEPESKAASWHWDAAKSAIVRGEDGYRHPQCSACFINSVEDSLDSILTLAKTEGMLFKFGSGTGTNLSVIRGSKEGLEGGGTASGPLSFMKGYDAFAGVIKSGGKTRRAAKMVILNADHPDIEEFIACKGREEAKAHTLAANGYDASGPDSEAYSSIYFQNANNSVRVIDEFMRAAEADEDWNLIARRDGSVVKTVKAKDLLRRIAEETWRCGDPGMQFDTTINRWHTSKASGRIDASNPCSEYMFLNDSACNLASLNLVKFLDEEDGGFDLEGFRAAVRLLIIAQDILVDLAGYPTETIARNSHDYRPLGLGYANLGALLLTLGIPYDSDEGRNWAAAITALMGGTAYRVSAEMAEHLAPVGSDSSFAIRDGSFSGFWANETPFREVMTLHHDAARQLAGRTRGEVSVIAKAAEREWYAVAVRGASFRNAQVTVLAPTGTIGFMMDCDTTGIEPMLGLVTWKKLVGGGMMKIVTSAVPRALQKLGYGMDEINTITAFIDEHGTIEGAPGLMEEDVPVFDCALAPANGSRSIAWRGHVGMMAAVQPFLSGAISKTVNLPASSTVDEIMDAYIEAWKKGLKSIAIYRDGSKAAQPLNTSKEGAAKTALAPAPANQPVTDQPPIATRNHLPDERASVTHKFNVGGYEGYVTVGLYPNGHPGEIFVRMSEEGSTISGLMDTFAMVFSMALQHGVPLKTITAKMVHTRFEPSGWTGNEEFGYATSIMDYLGKWLEARFGEGAQLALFRPHAGEAERRLDDSPANSHDGSSNQASTVAAGQSEKSLTALLRRGDAPLCANCGATMTPNGSCFKCSNCGGTSGCS